MSTAINRLRQAVYSATSQGKQIRRPAGWTNDSTSLEEARIEYAIRQAVVAAILFDPKGVEAILQLSDVEIGRLFKRKLCEAAGLATVYDLDLPSIREEEESLRKRLKRASKTRAAEPEALTESLTVNSERYLLVRQGKVLRKDDFLNAAAMTEKQLSKNVASGRIFSVDFGQEPYYPAFFLPSVIHRNDFAKVIRRLGETPGRNKWDFFKTPIESEGSTTPLQLLTIKKVKKVLTVAADFAERRAKQLSYAFHLQAGATMHWSQLDWGHLIRSSLPLLFIPAGAAGLGFAIGRLIRGRPYIGRQVGEPRR